MGVLAFAYDTSSLVGVFSPPPVEILKVALSLRFLQGKLEVFVHFRNFLEVI